MKEKLLFVDDDQNILASFQRTLRGQYDIVTALNSLEGLSVLKEQGPFAVIVSDYQMPGMNGIQFLVAAKNISSDTVRIMLTGQADMQAAIDAINQGDLFRFLLKPCSSQVLFNTLSDAINQYHLLIAEKELLEQTLQGSIKILSDILAIVSPEAFSHSIRVHKIATYIAKHLQVKNLWEVEMAAMLSQIGCITIPGQVLAKKFRGVPLRDDEMAMFMEHPITGKNLIANIPRLNHVAEAIGYQEKEFGGGGIPKDNRKGEDIPLLSRILKVVLDFDLIKTNGKTEFQAIQLMREQGHIYDPQVLDALEAQFTISQEKYEIRDIQIGEVLIGMIAATDIIATSGVLLVPKGQEITEVIKKRLLNFSQFDNVIEPIKVLERKYPFE